MMPIINQQNIATFGFDEDALASLSSNELIQNFGLLDTSGTIADGIYGDANGIKAVNHGGIDVDSAGAAGIFILGDDARVDNLGSISASGDLYDPDGILFSGDEFFADAIRIFGDRFQVQNKGEISASGFNGSGIIAVGFGGTVTNFGAIEGEGQSISGIFAQGDGNAGANYGSIAVSGDGSQGMFFLGSESQVINRGEIDVESGLFGFGLLSIGVGNQVANWGRINITSDFVGFGMLVEGSDNQAWNGGSISGSGFAVRGIYIENDSRLTNSGTVAVEGDFSRGIFVLGPGVEVINTGSVSAAGLNARGISFGLLSEPADNGRIENRGEISAEGEGAIAVHIFGDGSALTNRGLISAPDIAIFCGGEGMEAIQNYGEIVGDVELGGGADTYVAGHGGRLDGILTLGGGDDLVVLANGSGQTVVSDFQAGAGSDDVIDVSAFGIHDLNELLAAAEQTGADVAIYLDRDDRVVLQNVTLGQLDADDFLFTQAQGGAPFLAFDEPMSVPEIFC